MKKLIVMLFALIALVSCERFDLNSETTSKGNLKVSVYQIEQTPFSRTTRASLSEAATRVSFVVYDKSGSRVKQINQQSSDKDFGTVAFQIPEGEYNLAVVAHSSNGNPTMTDPTKVKFDNADGYSDTFLYQSNVTVGEETKELSVTLHRIVSLCRFVITDDYPADVTKMKFVYKGGSGAFNISTGLGTVNSTQTVVFDVTSGQKQFDLYTFLHATEGTIHLTATAHSASDDLLNEREFDVPLTQNHITWLSGSFFSGTGSSSTSITNISVNTNWAGESHLTF